MLAMVVPSPVASAQEFVLSIIAAATHVSPLLPVRLNRLGFFIGNVRSEIRL
jgi:hypothetical protein